MTVIAWAGIVVLFVGCGSGGSTSGTDSTRTAGSPDVPSFYMSLSGGVPTTSPAGRPTCFLGGLSPGSAHPFLDVELDDSTTQTKLVLRIPDVALSTYSPPSLTGVLSNPGFAQASPLPAGSGVPTGGLSGGNVRLLVAQGSGTGTNFRLTWVSAVFDLLFTFSPPAQCVFCKAPPPVVAKASGDFRCSAAAR